MVSLPRKYYRILIVGDSCYDEYHYGTVSRISPEAPVPVFDLKNTVVKSGMASNVLQNLINLIPKDERNKLELVTEYREIKHRYVDFKTGQQLLRVDEKREKPQYYDKSSLNNINNYHAVIISDYDKGFVREEDIKKIIKEFSGPIFVDTKKKDLSLFNGCFVKINQYEFEAAETLTDELIVTYGSKKVEYKNRTYLPPSVETHDVCGAGDTFLAGLVFNYLDTYDIDKAIKFAMDAAAITVQHRGVYAPTLAEVTQHAT